METLVAVPPGTAARFTLPRSRSGSRMPLQTSSPDRQTGDVALGLAAAGSGPVARRIGRSQRNEKFPLNMHSIGLGIVARSLGGRAVPANAGAPSHVRRAGLSAGD